MDTELAQKLVTGLKEAGINFITYLPETRLSQILPLILEDNTFTTVAVSSEVKDSPSRPEPPWEANKQRSILKALAYMFPATIY